MRSHTTHKDKVQRHRLHA